MLCIWVPTGRTRCGLTICKGYDSYLQHEYVSDPASSVGCASTKWQNGTECICTVA